MTLALVREEHVPVPDLVAGDRIILPSGARVTVGRVDRFGDEYVVRWWRPAQRGEPGFPGGKDHRQLKTDAFNGKYLGSLVGVPAGHAYRVDRG